MPLTYIFNSLQAEAKKVTWRFAGMFQQVTESVGAAYGNLTYDSEPNCVR